MTPSDSPLQRERGTRPDLAAADTPPAWLEAAYAHLVSDANALLGSWAPPSPEQASLRDEYLQLLADDPLAVAKAGPPGHLTASALVFDDSHKHVLLTHHRKARLWLQFGGHLEPSDPSVLAAAVREIREESGLTQVAVIPEIAQLDRHRLVGDFGRCRYHWDVRFAAVTATRAEPTVSEESLDVAWWPLDALPATVADELGDLITASRRLL